MRWDLGGVLAVAAGVTILLAVVSYRHYRFEVLGDVKDDSGQWIEDCKVELLLQWHVSANSTVYRARDTLTKSGGAFSFSLFAPPGSTFRLHVVQAGYQDWLLAGSSSRMPTRVHVTLRHGDRSPDAVQGSAV